MVLFLIADGSGHFVISDPAIQTFSLTGLVTLAAVLGTLIIIISFLSFVANHHGMHDKSQLVVRGPELFACPDSKLGSRMGVGEGEERRRTRGKE